MVHAVIEGHAWIHGPTTVMGCVDVPGPCYHWRPRECPWSLLLPEAMLMFLICTAIADHSEVHGMGWGPWHVLMLESRCQWSVLSPETIRKSMIHSPADCKGQGSYFCHGFDDCRHSLEKEERRGLLWHLPQSNSLDRKPSKRTLKTVIRIMKCGSP